MTRVVVADDQDLVRAGFRLILERNGVEVVGEARDGVEAVAVVEDTRPDVVLMDIRMPRLDGIEATRRITSRLPLCRVLVLTTFDLDEYVYCGRPRRGQRVPAQGRSPCGPRARRVRGRARRVDALPGADAAAA